MENIPLNAGPDIAQYFEPDTDLQELEEKKLLKHLEDRAFLDDVTQSKEWRIFREAWRRMYLDADEVLTKCKPTDVATIAYAQATKRFYSDVLTTTIQQIKEDANAAVQALKTANKLPNVRRVKKTKKRKR